MGCLHAFIVRKAGVKVAIVTSFCFSWLTTHVSKGSRMEIGKGAGLVPVR